MTNHEIYSLDVKSAENHQCVEERRLSKLNYLVPGSAVVGLVGVLVENEVMAVGGLAGTLVIQSASAIQERRLNRR